MALSRREDLHAHGAARVFRHRFDPVQASPTMTASHLSRVKLAVICGARSDLRRWSWSNFERRYQLILASENIMND